MLQTWEMRTVMTQMTMTTMKRQHADLADLGIAGASTLIIIPMPNRNNGLFVLAATETYQTLLDTISPDVMIQPSIHFTVHACLCC